MLQTTASTEHLQIAAVPDRPPELLLGAEDYNAEQDMWSVGILEQKCDSK